jgi:hypothetical protein
MSIQLVIHEGSFGLLIVEQLGKTVHGALQLFNLRTISFDVFQLINPPIGYTEELCQLDIKPPILNLELASYNLP